MPLDALRQPIFLGGLPRPFRPQPEELRTGLVWRLQVMPAKPGT